ncbi:MAG: hypothetical protein IJX82_03340 [Clostridia bacterium]|nr:hypothetical protein [Clostridia bacterium]
MKLFKKIILTVFILLFVAAAVFVSLLVYEIQFKKTEVHREESPDGAYEFVLYQVGAPGWPYGPVKAEIRVLDAEGDVLDKETIVIGNDGGNITVHNLDELRWSDTALEVVCHGEEGVTTYILELAEGE